MWVHTNASIHIQIYRVFTLSHWSLICQNPILNAAYVIVHLLYPTVTQNRQELKCQQYHQQTEVRVVDELDWKQTPSLILWQFEEEVITNDLV